MGRLCHKVQTLTLLYTVFNRTGTPFVYPLLTNSSPFLSKIQLVVKRE